MAEILKVIQVDTREEDQAREHAGKELLSVSQAHQGVHKKLQVRHLEITML